MPAPTKRTTPKKAKIVDGFLAELGAGCYDKDLIRLANAVGERIALAAPLTRWKLRFGGTTWTEQTVTTGERAYVEQYLTVVTGVPFSYLNLDPVQFIGHAAALVIAHLVKIDGLQPSKAIEVVEALTETQWREVIDVYQPSPGGALAGGDPVVG